MSEPTFRQKRLGDALQRLREGKSSRRNGNSAGVEIALTGSMARVRDSKNPPGVTVAVPAWATFLAAIKRDEFR